MNYGLAIFDSDGTLADTLPWIRSVFNDLAEEFGFRTVQPHEAERFRDLHGAALLRALNLPLWKVPRVVNGLRRRMSKHPGELCLFSGVSEVLQRLAAAGMHLAIVSSNSRANAVRILGSDNAKLIAHFACGASMFGKATKLCKVVRASAFPHEQVIYIGDEIRDAEAARQANVAFGAVGWGQHSEQALRAENPEEFFNTVREIAEKLAPGA